MEYVLFHITFLVYIIAILKLKEYKKSLSIFLLIVVTIFYSPVIYYTILGGTSYRVFDSIALSMFVIIGSSVFLMISILLMLKNSFKIKKRGKIIDNKSNILLNFYAFTIIIGVILYLVFFFRYLPFYQALKFGLVIDRPDSVGYIPYYFTFTAFSNLLIPGFYFYYINKINRNWLLKVFLLFTISIILISGGNKGFLAYFYIFILIYEFKLRINSKMIVLLVFLFTSYLLLSAGRIEFTAKSLEYIMSSPFRRFFVAQGSGFIVRIQLLNQGFDFTGIGLLKNYVNEMIYGTGPGGSSPTYFMGDLMVKYGYLGGSLFHIIIVSILVFISRYIDVNYDSNLYIKWNFFFILYLLGMAEISKAFMLRGTVLVVNMIIIYILARIKKQSKESNMRDGKNDSICIINDSVKLT